jgi:two-component system response regulator AtoC
VSVLISGSSGTGKELVAQHIHLKSKRRFENFVPINCGSIPSELVESELFGYEKGSFTGANAAKMGLFEKANHGTIFLDEIGELPLSAQVKLLRVIQEGEIEKIGRTEPVKVDVRIIAASNKELAHEVELKTFREDLYYRLNVVPVHVPQLRERVEDIPLLIDHFMAQFSTDMGKPVPEITDEAMSLLKIAPWKGNIRELKNVVQRLLFIGDLVISKETIQFVLGISDQELHSRHRQCSIFHRCRTSFHCGSWNDLFVRNISNSSVPVLPPMLKRRKKLGLAPSNYHRMSKELGIK